MISPGASRRVRTTNDFSELMASGTPLIAVSFADGRTDQDIAEWLESGLDIAELRVDRYTSFDLTHVVDEVKRYEAFPTIATIRSKGEGGSWDGNEDDRLELFTAIIPEVDAVDIELNSPELLQRVVDIAHAHATFVVVSHHNFDATPTAVELDEIALRAKRLGADCVKIAATATNQDDLRTLAAFTLRQAHLGLIVIAMGPIGVVSRVFFPALGSRLTFAHAGEYPVSGQLDYQSTFEYLRAFYPDFDNNKNMELTLPGANAT